MGHTARILVVDDDTDLRQALGDRLGALGLQVTLTGSGADALRLVREEGPAVVLLDLVLPGMDGMAVLEAVRREDPDTAVIVLTAYGTIARAVEAMKKGPYDFVTKPFDPKHLEIVVALEGSEELAQVLRLLALEPAQEARAREPAGKCSVEALPESR